MNYRSMDTNTRHLMQREALSQADLQVLWRLESGVLRIDSAGSHAGSDFVRLALPGDVLGVESLVGVKDRLVVRAITPARLVLVVLLEEGERMQLLMNAVMQGHQRCREVVSLRTDSAPVRLKRLLHMLANGDPVDTGEPIACTLPSLHDMATVINATPETVCRVLRSLRQLNLLQQREPRAVLGGASA
ncbi:MAG: Crp/Fnr family transcriptional regulator [Burkholderiaceae bacterium]|nr:Crp/Fnr family transcriptional regulator [Burkholderiaceae bacterium]